MQPRRVLDVVGPATENWRGRWLYELRLSLPAIGGKKKLTQAEFADQLVSKGVVLGGDARVSYVRLEKHGTGADDDLLARIAALYDVETPVPPIPASPADLAAVITEMQEQNRLLRELILQMTRIGDGQLAWGKALGQIAGKALERLDPARNPGEPSPRRQRRNQAQSSVT